MYYLNYRISTIYIFFINLSDEKLNSKSKSISNMPKSHHRKARYQAHICSCLKKHTDAHIDSRHWSVFRMA